MYLWRGCYDELLDSYSAIAMQLVLTPEIEAYVQQKLSEGKYQSPIDVLQAAVRSLQAQEDEEDIYEGRLAELQEKVQIGWEAYERGETVDVSTAMNQIRENLRKRHKA